MSDACRICATPVEPLWQLTVRRQYLVDYCRCPACGFVQTETPYWLAEAYARPINPTDTGILARNLYASHFLLGLILGFFPRTGRYLDYGGGHGILVRRMRDLGVDMRWYDAYCDNLFADGFAGDLSGAYDFICAFEVFEHLVDPHAEVARLLACTDTVVFSTSLVGMEPPAPDAWDYYAPDHGQHIAFYTRAALERLATRHDLHLYTDGRTYHVLSRRPRPGFMVPAARILARLPWLTRRAFTSRTIADYRALAKREETP